MSVPFHIQDRNRRAQEKVLASSVKSYLFRTGRITENEVSAEADGGALGPDAMRLITGYLNSIPMDRSIFDMRPPEIGGDISFPVTPIRHESRIRPVNEIRMEERPHRQGLEQMLQQFYGRTLGPALQREISDVVRRLIRHAELVGDIRPYMDTGFHIQADAITGNARVIFHDPRVHGILNHIYRR